ncbi:MAG: hypothetical protein F6K54_18025 [Okeania sp. SIO3B5]|uniref:hypothetical protein n=1 Tax=Okeania sp. SIO3B5 TaxID=2607811 RepID=UPI0014008ADE|nr:hypothetical protein [Okeania sp. SIO3B5]NEO54812.1 hypothetical protein [Okeania sp. SIO3B5]
MVKYTLKIANENQPNLNPVEHSLDLGYELENNPERLFNSEFRKQLRSTLQTKTSCSINDYHLKTIVETWMEDIYRGYRLTSLSLNLLPLEFDKIHQLQDPGDFSIPDLFPPDLSQICPKNGAFPPLIFN